MKQKLLLKFRPDLSEAVKDPRSNAAYVPIPKAGVEVGWSSDRMYLVKEGTILGFRMPLDPKFHGEGQESVEFIGRALSLAVKCGAGSLLEPVHLNCAVWGPELGHVYQRFVHPTWVYWSREHFMPLDEWFFMAEDFKFDNQEMILRTMQYGAMNDRSQSEYFCGSVIEDGPHLLQPRQFRCWKSDLIRYGDEPQIISMVEREFEAFLQDAAAGKDIHTLKPSQMVDLFYKSTRSRLANEAKERSEVQYFAERIERNWSEVCKQS